MEKIEFKFGTPKPVTFRESGCDTDFKVRIAGKAEVSDYDAVLYDCGEAGTDLLKQAVINLLPLCLLNWPEGKHVIGDGNCEILAGRLDKALADVGITAKTEIVNISLSSDQEAEYHDAIKDRRAVDRLDNMFTEPTVDDGEDDEAHGPLIGFGYNLSTHGMTIGSGSYTGYSIDWNDDGSVTLSICRNGGRTETNMEYKLKPEVAQKMRDLVRDKHLAALTKKKFETITCYDCFTSATIKMTFDDSCVGGSRYNMLHLYCGPAGMTFRTLENAVSDIIKECRKTGECTSFVETKTDSGIPGFLNIGAMKPSPVGSGDQEGGWTCPKCGYNKNTGKFCTECGEKR